MTTRARVVVLPAGGKTLEIATVDMPPPIGRQVLIEQFASGVCHSQLGHIARADPTKALLLGHESFGVVRAVGPEVDRVSVGDEAFVTWIPGPDLRKPEAARLRLVGGAEAHSRNVYTWGTHSIVDQLYVVRATEQVPGALASIVGCAVMTGAGAVLNSAKVAPGDRVAVWGVGGVGLAAISAARNAGAAPVIAIDIDDAKLALARRLGASHAVNAATSDAIQEVRRLTQRADGREGVDYSLDCTGVGPNFAKALSAVVPGRPGGTVGGTAIVVGVIPGAVELNGLELLNGQKSIVGCLGGSSVPDRDFEIFSEWYGTGRLDLDALVTDRYKLEQVNDAVDDLRAGRIRGRAVIEF